VSKVSWTVKYVIVRRAIFSLPAAQLCIAWFLTSLFLLPARAANGPEVEANYAEANFPSAVTFYLSAGSQAAVDSIELEYGLTALTCGPASAKARPDFESAIQVKTHWTWDFRKSGSPPPGARIWWRWHIRDKNGDSIDTPEQELFFDDPHYDWREIHSDELALYSAVPDQTVNQALWQAANQALKRLEGDLGARPARLVKIYNYPSSQELRSALLFSQEWTGGLTFPSYETILLGVNRDILEWGRDAVAHELAHVVIHQLTFNCLGDLPTWLDEGLAVHNQDGFEDDFQAAFDAARADDTLISLQSLSGSFPTSSRRANLAYAESGQVVGYLVATYGSQKMAELLRAFKEGSGYDQALQRVYGLDTQQLDNEWRASLGLPPRPIVTRAAPIALATLAPYGASTPTATKAPPPTLTRPPLTATPSAQPVREAAAPTSTPQAMPTARPTATPLPAAPPKTGAAWLPLSLGGMVAVGVLLVVVMWGRRSGRRSPAKEGEE